MVFGEMVRAYRHRHGMSQEALADATGLSVRGIRKIESGRVEEPRPATVRLLADALELAAGEREYFCRAAAGAPPVRDAFVPRQLPADVFGFTGRAEQIGQLDAMLSGSDDQGSAVVISAIGGTAGIGKTALAVHWAHRVADQFPGGQLYVNLRGYDPEQSTTAADALARFLAALGVPSQAIPVGVDERAARYRTELAGRERMLILLDNAATAEQVRPLLPGTPSCTVVVTSRDSLAGLVAIDGAHRIDLDLLPIREAITLLRALIGNPVDAEPDAATTLAERCVRLPLALRVAAELAVSRPTTPLADLVAELADQRRRLDMLAASGDPRAAVTAVFSWSIRHLPSDAVRAFRLLGLHPGPDVDAYAAAALADTSLDQARYHLELLTRAHLVHSTSPSRYGMHDLLRAYATNLATAEGSDTEGTTALTRLFDYYLATTADAMDRLYPAETERRPRIAPLGTPSPNLAGPDDARRWLDSELPCLVAVAAQTATRGWLAHATRLSTTLYRYLVNFGHYIDGLAIHAHAHAAAQQTGDRVAQAEALLGMGAAHLKLARYGPAADQYRQAMVDYRQAGDQLGEARALNNLGLVDQHLGQYRQAADHHHQALALLRQVGDEIGEAHALANLGTIYWHLGRYEVAVDHHQQALAVYRRAGHRMREAAALDHLGLAEQRLGQYQQAIDHHQQALALYRQASNRSGEASSLDNLGNAYLRLGQPELATEYFKQALALFRESGDRHGETWTLNGLGEAAHATGRPAQTIAIHTEAHAVATEIGARDQVARAHSGLGHAHHTLGDLIHARHHCEQALAIYTDLGIPDADDARAHLDALTVKATGRTAAE